MDGLFNQANNFLKNPVVNTGNFLRALPQNIAAGLYNPIADVLNKGVSTLRTPNPQAKGNLFKSIQQGASKTAQVAASPEALAAGAEAASFAVPFGRGANFLTKAVLPGAVAGGVYQAGQPGATPENVGESALFGAGTAGAIHGAGALMQAAAPHLKSEIAKAAYSVAVGADRVAQAPAVKFLASPEGQRGSINFNAPIGGTPPVTAQPLIDKLMQQGTLAPAESQQLFADPALQQAKAAFYAANPKAQAITDKAINSGDARGVLTMLTQYMTPETRAMIGDINRADSKAAGQPYQPQPAGIPEVSKTSGDVLDSQAGDFMKRYQSQVGTTFSEQPNKPVSFLKTPQAEPSVPGGIENPATEAQPKPSFLSQQMENINKATQPKPKATKLSITNIENPAQFQNPKNVSTYDRTAIEYLKTHPEELNKPILVSAYGKTDNMGNTTHFIENGQHRYQAHKELGHKEIDAIIRQDQTSAKPSFLSQRMEAVNKATTSPLSTFEESVKNNPKESMAYFNNKGEKVYQTRSNNKYSAKAPVEDLKKLNGVAVVSSHNHHLADVANPTSKVNDVALAPDINDLSEAIARGVKEVRTVSPLGVISDKFPENLDKQTVADAFHQASINGELAFKESIDRGEKPYFANVLRVKAENDTLVKGLGITVTKTPATDFLKSSVFTDTTGDKAIDSKSKIVQMSPDEYLKKAFENTDGKLGGSYESWLNSNQNDSKVVQAYAQHMRNGDKFPVPYLDEARGSQEGRTRALAAKMLGQKTIPVAVVPKMTPQQEVSFLQGELNKNPTPYMKNYLTRRLANVQPAQKPSFLNTMKAKVSNLFKEKIPPTPPTPETGAAKERGFVTTVKESPQATQPLKNLVSGTYNQKANTDLIANANARIAKDPVGATAFAMQENSDEATATAIQLVKKLSKEKNFTTAADLVNKKAAQLTEAGRTIQAAKLFDSLSPEGIGRLAARTIQKYNEVAKQKIPELNGDQLKAFQEMAAKVQSLPEGTVEKMQARASLYQLVSDLTPKSWVTKLHDNFGQAMNLPRAIMATADLSAPLRQGVFLVGRPKQWIPAFGDMLRYSISEKAYQKDMAALRTSPNYDIMEASGLKLTDASSSKLTSREEAFMSNWSEKIPVFGMIARSSNRSYTGFLNKLRANTFDDLYKKAQETGVLEKRPLVAKSIANFVNTASGRGDLGAFERAAVILNSVFFSPRLMASRLNLLNPVYYMKLDPFVRKEALKSLISFASAAIAVTSLAKMAGAQVGDDPRSSDFGKIKIGDTRYDPYGGFQQYIVAATRLLTGQMVSSTTGREIHLGEGFKATTRLDIAQRVFETKEAPIASFITSMLRGQTATGQAFNLPTEVVDRFIPMLYQDMFDLQREWGAKGYLMAVPGLFGVGVQTYGDDIPMKGKTASGKPNIQWQQQPDLGETLLNKVTGNEVSNIPQSEWAPFQAKRQADTLQQIAVDKAKADVLATGKPEWVGTKYVHLNQGVVEAEDKGYKPPKPSVFKGASKAKSTLFGSTKAKKSTLFKTKKKSSLFSSL